MENREISVIVYLCFVVFFYFYYFRSIKTGEAQPPLSFVVITWLGILVSFWSFLMSSNKDYLGGIMNTVDVLGILLLIIVVYKWSKGTSDEKLKRFERKYLYFLGGTILVWLFSGNHDVANFMGQGLMTYAYFPFIEKLATEEEKTESPKPWWICLITCIVGIWPSTYGEDYLQYIYVSRAIFLSILILSLIYYYEDKRKKQELADQNV